MGIDLVHQLAGKHVVYTLALEGGRRYVGQTQNIEKRLAEHLEKRGAKWTQEHKVIDVISSVSYTHLTLPTICSV